MFRLSVVVKTKTGYKDYHVDLNITDPKHAADFRREVVARHGFRAEGVHYFPDQIESLILTELPDAQKGLDCQEGGEHKETDRTGDTQPN